MGDGSGIDEGGVCGDGERVILGISRVAAGFSERSFGP